MRLLHLSALVLAAFAGTPSYAAELRLNLSATVPTLCAVNGMRSLNIEGGVVQVEATCNAASFSLVMGGELAALPIKSASTVDARLTVRGNTVVVRPDRPGRFTFDIVYDADLADVRSAVASIKTA